MILHTAIFAALRSSDSGMPIASGHMSAEFVDDRHLVLRNAGRTVEDDGEAGKPPADFFENVEAKLGILTGLNL